MSGYGIGYDLVKEKQARMIREAANARMVQSLKQVQSQPSGLRSLLMRVLPHN